VALGLPLPPSAGKRRLSFLMQPEDIVSTTPPPTLRTAGGLAPRAWRPTLDAVDALASRHSVQARVFGSLAWRALTGLDYLTDRSDLDLLLYVHRDTDLRRLTAELAEIEAAAPMRLDGELVRDDAAAVNWRELHAGAREILVKTVGGVALVDTSFFLLGTTPSLPPLSH
jgi:phosphoribosyl-dephospho-CoA transferase